MSKLIAIISRCCHVLHPGKIAEQEEAQLPLISLTFGGGGGPPREFTKSISRRQRIINRIEIYVVYTKKDIALYCCCTTRFLTRRGIFILFDIKKKQKGKFHFRLELFDDRLNQLFNSSVVLNHLYAAHVIIIILIFKCVCE